MLTSLSDEQTAAAVLPILREGLTPQLESLVASQLQILQRQQDKKMEARVVDLDSQQQEWLKAQLQVDLNEHTNDQHMIDSQIYDQDTL